MINTTPASSMSAGQVNLWLAVAVVGAVATGLVSWGVGTEWSRWWTAIHAVFGVMVLVLAPAKSRRSVRAGMRRGRPSRWVSALFGVLVLGVIVLGFAHSTGGWTGVGYWTSLWSHFLLAFIAVPLLIWHIAARPVKPAAVDLDRRMLLGGGAVAGVAALAVGTVEVAVRVLDTSGAERRFTGSHEIASMNPAAMPTVSWIDDSPPAITTRDDWKLEIGGTVIDLDELAARAKPLEAALDCTGGWWSLQAWDVVPVADLLAATTRSFTARSATGYTRSFAMRDAADVFVAVGYGGEPLARGHGAPVRLVAPGRRGPWWVKWVTEIEASDRPWWMQLPFPAD